VTIGWEAAAGSDIGRNRAANEDAFHADAVGGIFLVADGMGGHAAGEVASAMVAKTVAARLAHYVEDGGPGGITLPVLSAACAAAHSELVGRCAREPAVQGMGTTLTACVLNHDGAARIAHIGDSRLYRLRAGKLTQLTRDHTWVQSEVDAGRMTLAASRRHRRSHILTRVLTDDMEAEVDLLSTTVQPHDTLLLATDGLYNMLRRKHITIILQSDLSLEERVAKLIEAANDRGGKDNISVVVITILTGDQ
jgi:protein phosphatase